MQFGLISLTAFTPFQKKAPKGPFILKPNSLGQPGLNGVRTVFRFPFLQRSVVAAERRAGTRYRATLTRLASKYSDDRTTAFSSRWGLSFAGLAVRSADKKSSGSSFDIIKKPLVSQNSVCRSRVLVYETTILRQFAGLSLERIPDETTILNFRRLLEKHELAAGTLGVINGYLSDRGLSLRQGTIVDATLIHAPSSTKNQDGKRDPEMHQAKKGNQWYFGMKAHIGVDDESGLVHSVVGTAANVADVTRPRRGPFPLAPDLAALYSTQQVSESVA
jgi:hypothetical protein